MCELESAPAWCTIAAMSESESRASTGYVSAGLPSLTQRGREALAQLSRPVLHEVSLASYRKERVTDLTFPVGLALLEGGFLGVLADKVFHVHPALLALISAAPMFGNLSSFFWARVAEGRRTVPM